MSFFQTYGYETLITLKNLERCGLIRIQNAHQKQSGASGASGAGAGGKTGTAQIFSDFSALRKQFRLIVENVNEQEPNDLAYVFSGFAPLLPRLCQFLQKPGWNSMVEPLKKLPGPAGHEVSGEKVTKRKFFINNNCNSF